MGVNVFPVPVGAIYCINEFSGLFAIDNNDFCYSNPTHTFPYSPQPVTYLAVLF